MLCLVQCGSRGAPSLLLEQIIWVCIIQIQRGVISAVKVQASVTARVYFKTECD